MDKAFPIIPWNVHTYHNNYQDDKSTIQLAQNGRTSSSRRTKHPEILNFFVTDMIEKGDVNSHFVQPTTFLQIFYKNSTGHTVHTNER